MTDVITQRKRILEYLSRGFTMTGIDGLAQAGTMKLATRIGELIRQGHPIVKEWITVTSGNKKKRIMSYRMRLDNECKLY
jgi:hypothetical protein